MRYLLIVVTVWALFSTCDAIAQPAIAIDAGAGNTPKPTFKAKHPKVYRAFKKTRTVCRFMLPIVQCAGSTAQILFLFI